MNPKLFYDGFLQRVANAFDVSLAAIDVGYNLDYGIELEVAVCRTLRAILPQRFGVCRGYIVNKAGSRAGDDIIIYDKMGYPTTRMLTDDFVQKEKVPVEAVAAYIEAKHALCIDGDDETRGTLAHALKQVAAVKALANGRQEMLRLRKIPVPGLGVIEPSPQGWPQRLNPFYAAIFSRHIKISKDSKDLSDPEAVNRALLEHNPEASNRANPDLIVAGRSNVLLPAFHKSDGIKEIRSPFMVDDAHLATIAAPNLAFGVALAHLLWALDNIQLGQMEWGAIVGNGLGLL
jgi:hypothetical protein